MFKIVVFLLTLGLIVSVLEGVFIIIRVIFFFVLGILGLSLLYLIVRSVYHLFSPKAKQKYKDKINREKKENEAWRIKQEEIEKENLRKNIGMLIYKTHLILIK